MPCNCIDRNTLKNKFKQCAKPTEQDFATLIDAFFHPCEDDTICNNLTLEGTDGFNQPGETATLFLGDEHHSIKSTNAKGVSISTYGANDAIFVEQGTGSVGIGTTTPSGCGSSPRVLDVNGDVRVQGTLCADTLMIAGSGLIPVGGIIMWSGSTAPTGWALCDGTNGTPDLRGRFIVGHHPGGDTEGDYGIIGNDGGVGMKKVKLKDSQCALPNHNHSINDPGHTHGYDDQYTPATGEKVGKGGERQVNWEIDLQRTTRSGTTNISINNSSKTWADDFHENRPPYFVLAFIKKL